MALRIWSCLDGKIMIVDPLPRRSPSRTVKSVGRTADGSWIVGDKIQVVHMRVRAYCTGLDRCSPPTSRALPFPWHARRRRCAVEEWGGNPAEGARLGAWRRAGRMARASCRLPSRTDHATTIRWRRVEPSGGFGRERDTSKSATTNAGNPWRLLASREPGRRTHRVRCVTKRLDQGRLLRFYPRETAPPPLRP
jgi:hypothetical protein